MGVLNGDFEMGILLLGFWMGILKGDFEWGFRKVILMEILNGGIIYGDFKWGI